MNQFMNYLVSFMSAETILFNAITTVPGIVSDRHMVEEFKNYLLKTPENNVM